MLIYVDLEHPHLLSNPTYQAEHGARCMAAKRRFEALSGQPCLILHYWQFAGQGWLERLEPQAVLLSGLRSDWELFEQGAFDALLDFIRAWPKPMIGFCGGHQLIAFAFGGTLGPLRLLEAGETDPEPSFGPGYFKEVGMQPVTCTTADTLFAGLDEQIAVYQEHYWEVKTLPPALINLASSETCPVQAFQHASRPTFGTQFHPERWDEAHTDGERVLRNFFDLL